MLGYLKQWTSTPRTPRPAGSHHIDADSTWYSVDDDLTDTIAAAPMPDAEHGDDWILSFTAAGATADDRERVCVRLTSRALHELYIKAKDLSADSR